MKEVGRFAADLFAYHLSLSISVINRAIGIHNPITTKTAKIPRLVSKSGIYVFISSLV